MARVDLQCGCGYMFFVGDAQLKTPGGIKCPACLHPVKAPAGAVAAAKPAASKAGPPRKPAAAPPPEEGDEGDEEVDFSALPPASAPASNSKLYVIGGVVATVVVAIIVTLVLVLKGPSVDYEKEAQKAEEARKKAFEEISSKGSGKPSAPAGATPAVTSTTTPAKPSRSTEFKPMAPANTTPAPSTTPAKPQTPATPQAGTPAAGAVALSVEMVGRVKSEVLSLHPFYLSLVLTPGEKARLDGIATTGRGVPDDADFVQSVLTGGKLKSVRDEVALISQTLPTLDRESQENLPVDRITLVEGGRVMNCKILDEGAEIVKVSRTLASGVGGQMPFRRDAISRIEKGKGIGAEFAARWEAAQKGTLASQVEVLSWCKDNTLSGQAKLVAFTILRADPSNTLARTEAGLPSDPVKQAEEISKGGMIAYQGKNWNPKQLKDKFISDGFCLLDGKWFSKKDKMIVVPGLFRYERQQDKPVSFTGSAPLCHDKEIVYKQMQDVNTGQFIEQSEERLLRRFYSPEMVIGRGGGYPAGFVPPVSTAELDIRVEIDTGIPLAGTKMSGEVLINVPVGGTILEASVITTAEVKAGGSIVVYHIAGAGTGENEKRTKLYSCDPKESQSHVIPVELVRGATEVNLVAVIEQVSAYSKKVERRHVRGATYKGKIIMTPAVDIIHHKEIPEYKAVLFPSNSNTVEVFRLRCAIADPSPQLDKLFAANPEVLK